MRLDDVLLRQAGLITLDQAVACGMSRDAVARRVRSGAWSRVRPGVYLVAGHRRTGEVRIRAVMLWAGEEALLSGQAAAFWHGMSGSLVARLEITVPPRRSPRPQPGVRIRRRTVDPADRTTVRGVALTGPARTALDVAVGTPDGSVFLDRALQHHVRFPALYRAYCRMLGSAGSAAAGRLIVAAADRADSAAERLLVRLLREAGSTGWVLGLPFGPYRVGLAFPAERVAVEVDGWAWHVDVDRFRADRRKGNALVASGWNLLRFTWHDLTGWPANVVDGIETARRLGAQRKIAADVT